MKLIEVDIVKKLHTISGKGSFPFQNYRQLEGGTYRIYLERPMIGHPTYDHLSLYLLPDLGIQVCKYHRSEGSDWFDWYIDIIEAKYSEGVWSVTDLFADVVVRDGESYRIFDLDELGEAYKFGVITEDQLAWALDSLQRICNLLHSINCCVGDLIKQF